MRTFVDKEQQANLDSIGFISQKNDSDKWENKGGYKKTLQ